MNTYRNLRTEARVNLKTANKEWADCVAKNFLPQWLNGASIDINSVCKDELQRMNDLDKEVYPDVPFRTPDTA